MIINHNIASLNTQRQLSVNTANQSKNIEKLSSGLRINRAGDDAAGLAISEKMRGQIRGLDQASRNGQDAISLIQTAEGALNETHSILQRMRELGVQSATDTNTADDRGKIQQEVDQLAKEISRISNTTEFNTQNLLAGGLSNTYQIGSNANQNLSLSISAMDAQSLGVAGATTTTTFANTNTGVGSLTTTSSSLNGTFLNVAKVVAAAGTVTGSNALGGTGTAGGTYTGSKDVTFQVKATSAAGGDVTGASYSTDGGTTWTNAAVTVTAGTSTAITLADGASLTVAFDAQNATNDTWTFSQSAEYLNMQLGSANNGGTTIGSTVKVYNNQSSVTLGDAASDRVATVNFDFNTVKGSVTATGTAYAAGDSDAITQSQVASTSAVTGGGKVVADAQVQKGINVSTQGAANNAITAIDKAITTVSSERSKLGAYQNRLEHTINNLNTSSENLSAAESRIRDVDMAKEMSDQTKNSILAQAAQAMLAQANQQPQGVLQLLR
ncbi:flagellin [Paenibacillus tianjinensis]|uniref:Flagellin n=2 Tax=Paenibacillus tianjinensis TaxID=2810347 RepID=A0ABX7LKH7_9BACL|nr:flagellin [Paenibacillus tianjinensis]